ncbi:surface antigen-domain-containing protein [Protomyces lactucae-debilis]|uniref:Surface antigen-domain-containing protein n=1 Tax=Protomyces lactucae-debilis TaxID=2754530 RepID=A0A1Y2FGU6_PROLT|nr:surface antigen-domain-containing protein [Protomyces lactucae-debilis]ORY82035.1 surface antigen-domain-containing protein [Protomyces lactucae-debilis]
MDGGNAEDILRSHREAASFEEEQEQAVQERLNTFYHYAGLRLSDMVDRNGSLPAKLKQVTVLGTPHTRPSFLAKVLGDVLNQPDSATLRSSLDALSAAATRLAEFGIYESVVIDVDKIPFHRGASEHDLAATLHCKERSRISARTGTDFGNQEGSAYASINIRNAFGGAESLEGNVAFGTRTRASYEARLTTPIDANPQSIFELLGYAATRANTHASHEELVQGLSASVKQLSVLGRHDFGIHAVARTITNLSPGASLAIRQSAGDSQKFSLTHAFVHDRRDDVVVPTTGYRLGTTQELALPLTESAAAFAKAEVQASRHGKVGDVVLSLSAKGGLLWTLAEQQSMLNDRFQLGGPTSVRGFQYAGLGPRPRGSQDALGGDVYLSTCASIMHRVPFAPESWPIKAQTFVATGALLPLDKQKPRQTLQKLLTNPSVSAGIGLVFRHPAARIEMSFCLPLIARPTDQVRKGLQFGLGVDFM